MKLTNDPHSRRSVENANDISNGWTLTGTFGTTRRGCEMTLEYGDAIKQDVVDAAVLMTVKLRGETPSLALERLVEQTVRRCGCVIDGEDEIEHGLSGTHAAMTHEARRRVHLLDAAAAQNMQDRIDESSRESYPASDPPAWIWRRAAD